MDDLEGIVMGHAEHRHSSHDDQYEQEYKNPRHCQHCWKTHGAVDHVFGQDGAIGDEPNSRTERGPAVHSAEFIHLGQHPSEAERSQMRNHPTCLEYEVDDILLAHQDGHQDISRCCGSEGGQQLGLAQIHHGEDTHKRNGVQNGYNREQALIYSPICVSEVANNGVLALFWQRMKQFGHWGRNSSAGLGRLGDGSITSG